MLTDPAKSDRSIVNNQYYDQLVSWEDLENQPVALLRAEGQLKLEWVRQTLATQISPQVILDIGCGGGFQTNALAQDGHRVTGVDLSEVSLRSAAAADSSGRANYQHADAYCLPFKDAHFDTVICFDFLEHVSKPHLVIKEAARVLKPGGSFFYHTFNRNWVSHLVAIKGVEWFVQGTPKNLHVIELFISPKDLHRMLDAESLFLKQERGLRPVFNMSFFKLFFSKKIDPSFTFAWTQSKIVSYAGLAQKI